MADWNFRFFLENSDEGTVTLLALWIRRKRKEKSIHRYMWGHPVLQFFGENHLLIRELALDGVHCREYSRVCQMQFEFLTRRIGSLVTKQTTKYKEAIFLGGRLAICLR